MKEREMEEMEEAVEEEDSKELEKLESQFFHHYTGKENNATANTMLLFKHLYQCDNDRTKFFNFLKELFKEEVEGFDPDSSSGPVVFELQKRNTEGAQEKNKEEAQESPQESQEENIEDVQKEGNYSIPDACISQANFFKIVIETKLSGNSFEDDQLIRHLGSFGSEEHKILMTLAPSKMRNKNEFDRKLKREDKSILHVNLTFSDLVSAMEEMKLDVVYEVKMSDVFKDYKDYCDHDDLLADPSRTMIVKWVSKTHEFNTTKNAYHNTDSDFRAHYDYLGLCIGGHIRFIGKFCDQITICEIDIDDDDAINTAIDTIKSGRGKKKDKSAIEKCEGVIKEAVKKIKLVSKEGEKDKLTEYECVIKDAIAERLINDKDTSILRQHTYYFVDGFYETNYYRKIHRSPHPFDLIKDLGLTEDDLSGGAKGIAEALKGKTWE